MHIIRGIHNLKKIQNATSLTIGNFDGVHLGHRMIIEKLVQKSKEHNLCSVVMLFEPHPNEFFKKNSYRISTFRDKINRLQSFKIDYLLCIPFNHQFSIYSAKEFIKNVLISKLNIKYLILGKDFHFGYNRKGNISLLKQYSQQYYFKLEIVNNLLLNNQRISSTLIREKLLNDEIPLVNTMTHIPFSFSGKIKHGDNIGITLGFPTANLYFRHYTLPLFGVFAVKLLLHPNKKLLGVANMGYKPTFNKQKKYSVEIYLFNFNELIYGKILTVTPIQKIRNEQKFNSILELQSQIKKDIQIASNIFNNFVE